MRFHAKNMPFNLYSAVYKNGVKGIKTAWRAYFEHILSLFFLLRTTVLDKSKLARCFHFSIYFTWFNVQRNQNWRVAYVWRMAALQAHFFLRYKKKQLLFRIAWVVVDFKSIPMNSLSISSLSANLRHWRYTFKFANSAN